MSKKTTKSTNFQNTVPESDEIEGLVAVAFSENFSLLKIDFYQKVSQPTDGALA